MATHPAPAPSSLHYVRKDPRLDRDAADLHRSISDLIRVYQFRERDKICCHDLSVTQCHALEMIAGHGPLSMNHLAARLFLDKSTTSRVVDALERKDYAVREPNPSDRRALRISATPGGVALLRDVRDEVLCEEKLLLAGFEPAVRREMARLIGRLARAAAARVDTSGGTCSSIDAESPETGYPRRSPHLRGSPDRGTNIQNPPPLPNPLR
ncbi:MAG: MarR family transcriptional regulator [Gemmatimonas sp.]|nr:MarR family transcriptional regulator [Gemmatimonas sp.]